MAAVERTPDWEIQCDPFVTAPREMETYRGRLYRCGKRRCELAVDLVFDYPATRPFWRFAHVRCSRFTSLHVLNSRCRCAGSVRTKRRRDPNAQRACAASATSASPTRIKHSAPVHGTKELEEVRYCFHQTVDQRWFVLRSIIRRLWRQHRLSGGKAVGKTHGHQQHDRLQSSAATRFRHRDLLLANGDSECRDVR